MNNKSLYVFLFCSLLVNAFLLGVLISSHVLKPKISHMNPVQRHFAQIELAKENLPPESQVLVDRIWHDQRKKIKNNMRSMIMFMRELQDILTAPEFDLEALRNLRDKMDGQGTDMKKGFLNAMMEIATKLPPDERIEYFENAFPDMPFPMARLPFEKNKNSATE